MRRDTNREPIEGDTPELTPGVSARRAVYERPRLDPLGDVRDLTLGGSPGLSDSSNPGIQKVMGT